MPEKDFIGHCCPDLASLTANPFDNYQSIPYGAPPTCSRIHVMMSLTNASPCGSIMDPCLAPG